MDRILFDGELMPVPKKEGIKIKKEKIWSKNTNRTANGTMVGDVIAIKYTISIEWAVLSKEDVVLLDSKISKPFFSVTFPDIDGTEVTKQFYAGTPTYPTYSWVDGMPRIVGTAVDLIEQ